MRRACVASAWPPRAYSVSDGEDCSTDRMISRFADVGHLTYRVQGCDDVSFNQAIPKYHRGEDSFS
jgi:hypothetical protein